MLLVTEWGKCLEPDGYFCYSRQPNAPHYTYDKMMWGLLDAYHYCGNREALQYAGRITDWAIKNLPRIRQLGHTATEWYTLSENLYRAYLLTGDPKYRDFAREWEYTEYWDIYARNADLFARRPDGRQTNSYHAYSHVNTLGGAGAAYLVTGQPRYLDILKNAYDYLQSHETFATGGYGPDEQLLPRDKLIRQPLLHVGDVRDAVRLVGGVQDGPLPDDLHRRGPLRRLGRTPGVQRHRGQHPHDA